jgi:hypothetical protein
MKNQIILNNFLRIFYANNRDLYNSKKSNVKNNLFMEFPLKNEKKLHRFEENKEFIE